MGADSPGFTTSKRRAAAAALVLGLAILTGGCARTVVAGDLTAFGTAASDIGKQADLSFRQSNSLARDMSVERFIRSGAVGLNEQQFMVAVSAEDMAAWQEALSGLERYGTGLASLVDTARGTATSNALVGLGNQLASGRTGIEISPEVGGAFASLAGALVNASAQRSAREILMRTDPSIQSLLNAMAVAIGETDRDGLRGTVYANWAASFTGVQRAYAQAAEARNEADQRRLVGQFLAALDKRDAQLRSLAALRSSLLSLAAAHSAAAQGAPASVASLLQSIEERLDETKRLYDAFEEDARERRSGGNSAGGNDG
jgi:hypothetical protein